MSLIDRALLQCHNPKANIKCTKTQIKIKGLRNSSYDASEYVEIDLYIRGLDNFVAHINQILHIIENLPAEALISQPPKGGLQILIDKKLTMPSCHGISVQITTRCHDEPREIPIFAKKISLIQHHFRAMIVISTSRGNKLL